jgi:hypothetical protein
VSRLELGNMDMRRALISTRTARPRGFLLLVVVGLLAVMLTLVVGFLSFTRNQAEAVIHVRDRSDAVDLAQSAMDFTIANICARVIDPATNKFDPTKWVSNSNDDTVTGGGQWWYAPYEPECKSRTDLWNAGYVSTYMQQKDAKWRYMPADYFPDGGVRARFAVQVVDANSAIHLNDWLDDCNPTQCQMAHMLIDGVGLNYNTEVYRSNKDGMPWSGPGVFNQPGPYRYSQCWDMATRTVRYYHHNWSFTGNYKTASPNYMTTNTSWFSPYGAEYNCLHVPWYDEFGPVAATQEWEYFYHRVGLTFSPRSGSDPDTGRSPINVNTCEVSCQEIPYSVENHTAAFTLEGVFNVESLARIIKVGKFWFDADKDGTTPKVLLDAQNPATWVNESGGSLNSTQTKDAWILHEKLRMKLAYWYQELLVRYFCGAYNPAMYGNAYSWVDDWNNKLLFRWFAENGNPQSFDRNRSYYQAFGFVSTQAGYMKGALTAAEVNKVKYAVKPGNTSPANNYPASAYYKTTRFPVSVEVFRQRVAEDFKTLTQDNNNWTSGIVCPEWLDNSKHYAPIAPGTYFTRRYYHEDQAAKGVIADGELCVNFDINNTPEIIPGKMDKRTANAVFDNIIPGKVWKDAAGGSQFLLFPGHAKGVGVSDPLWELYSQRIGRDEYDFSQYNRRGLWVSTGSPQYNEKGKDIVTNPASDSPFETRAKVPWRQLAFGPDSFSTELTTTSNTFWVVVTTQIVDAKSAIAFPNNPEVKTTYMQSAVVELTPDIEVNTDPGFDGATWPTAALAPGGNLDTTTGKRVGLGYYRGGAPKKLKTMKVTDAANAAPDYFSMDEGMKTAFDVGNSRWLPVLPESSTTIPPPDNTTSNPTAAEWVDFRGVKDADRTDFYKEQAAPADKGRQTSKRVIIRQLWTTNQGL